MTRATDAGYLTSGQLARQLGVSEGKVLRAAATGILRAAPNMPNGALRFLPAEVEQYAADVPRGHQELGIPARKAAQRQPIRSTSTRMRIARTAEIAGSSAHTDHHAAGGRSRAPVSGRAEVCLSLDLRTCSIGGQRADTLKQNLHDNRFLRLIAGLLQAGYLEDWRYHATLSGSPQGSVLSPILSNLYLDQLDRFVESTLLPAYNRGERRRLNPPFLRLQQASRALQKKGQHQQARRMRRQMQSVPSLNPTDPDYRRLHYLRYANDVRPIHP
jgi:hypothetical protein